MENAKRIVWMVCAVAATAAVLFSVLTGCVKKDKRLSVKVLLLPHFESGEMVGDFPGEAQLFYEEYLNGKCDTFVTETGYPIYYNRESKIAMSMTGSGKVNTAVCLTSVLSDKRFDFSEAYIFTFGCAGGSTGVSVPGDVVFASAAIDFDLGHTADIRDMSKPDAEQLWFHDASYDEVSHKLTDAALTRRVYELTKDIVLDTTENTKKAMQKSFPGEEWAKRDPKVTVGTVVTSDDFWKGEYGHAKAEQITAYYGCPDPYMITEMEDVVTAVVAEKFGLSDKLIIMRANVNVDVFTNGDTPESLWSEGSNYNEKVQEENSETMDIFETAMYNNFKVGKVVIEAILDGSISK